MNKNNLNEREIRINKTIEMKKLGINPYAQSFNKKETIKKLIEYKKDIKNKANELLNNGSQNKFSTAGRMISFRSHGKISFAKLRDSTGDIQICFVRDLIKLDLGNNKKPITNIIKKEGDNLSIYKFIQKYIDVGDFIGVKGDLFITKHGELTLFVNELKFLSKAIRPLPEKFHGLQDQEAKYRQRYLDLTSNNESYQRFRQRSLFLKTIRDFYHKNGFIEVETSVLGNSASGAAAKPFITHHNDFDIDMYLRISPETALKKLTAGRFEKVFEIAKDFRNEGSDPSHIQEFTMIEHYVAFRNFEDNMKFTEKMFEYIFDKMPYLKKKVKIKNKDGIEKEVDFSTPRQKIDYIAQIKKDCGIDVSQYKTEDETKLRDLIKSKGFSWEGLDIQTTPTMIDYLYKKVTRPKIIGPAFIYNYPKTMQPLARVSDKNNNIVEQRQLLINGWEVIKAYSELVDPLLQQKNFDEQSDALKKGDEEATSGDNEFVIAMEYGMPCQSGRGMGIDRIFALLTEQENIRDVVLFPLMKPTEKIRKNTKKESEKIKNQNNSCKKTSKKDFFSSEIVEQAKKIAKKYLKDTYNHCKQVGQIMKFFANKLGEDENLRYIAGLLHDVDRDYINKDGNKHLGKDFNKIIEELKPYFGNEYTFEQFKNDLKTHAHFLTGIQPETLMAKYLCSIDELSGLIYAYSLMRPNGMEGLKAKSIKKKIKDKSFASKIDRNEVKNCEKFLGLNLDEFITDVIKGMSN